MGVQVLKGRRLPAVTTLPPSDLRHGWHRISSIRIMVCLLAYHELEINPALATEAGCFRNPAELCSAARTGASGPTHALEPA
jgi:hypothetical protein